MRAPFLCERSAHFFAALLALNDYINTLICVRIPLCNVIEDIFNNSLHLYSAFLDAQSALQCEGYLLFKSNFKERFCYSTMKTYIDLRAADNRACERSWAVRIPAPRSRGCSLSPLHRSKSQQTDFERCSIPLPAHLQFLPTPGEIAPRSLKFKIPLHA